MSSNSDLQPSRSDTTKQMDSSEEMIITSISATDVVLGLRRLPVGFYTAVHHSGLEWRTEIKCALVNQDVVEWTDSIPIPSTPSAVVRLGVYASFEFQPMLGTGEQLRKLSITVEELLDRGTRDAPFVFTLKDGDMVSPCSSIYVTVKQKKCKNSDPSRSVTRGPHSSTTNSYGELEGATNRGHSALSRYQRRGERQDLEYAIAEFDRALWNCPQDHACRAAAQSNLATARFILCQAEDTDALLPLNLYRDVLTTRPTGHLDRPSTLIHLAAVHLARFEKSADEAEGTQVEALLNEAMELSRADSHENRASAFMLQLRTELKHSPMQGDGRPEVVQGFGSNLTDEDLWNASFGLLEQFEQFGDLADLEHAIAILKALVQSTPVWDGWHCASLVNLSVALSYRFKCLGELGDLEDAISAQKAAVDLTPHNHPEKPGRISNLGSSVAVRFECFGDPSDLDDAISILQAAVDLAPHGHPGRPGSLNNLGCSFRMRFDRFGEMGDLDDALLNHRTAADLTPDGNPVKPGYLSNLGNSLTTHFQCLGEPSDLEAAVLALQNAVNLTPHGHPEKPSRLNSLGNSLRARFRHLGGLGDLEAAILAHQASIDLTPRGHPSKSGRLNNLGNAFTARFEHLGQLSDLEGAISTHQAAVDLIPHGHPHKPGYLGNLGSAFKTRYERLKELTDLEEAISSLRGAVDLTPRDHPDHPSRLDNLGASFFARFEHLGELNNLEQATSTFQTAFDLTPDGHISKPARLHHLGICFRTRFDRLGELGDLENAISVHKDAVDLKPDEPRFLNDLGHSFFTRFERLKDLGDLERAVSNCRAAIDLTPHGHPDRASYLSGLGNCLRARFGRLGGLDDINNAISTLKAAVSLVPDGDPICLNNLGISFNVRFEHLGEPSDLEDAISILKTALEITLDSDLEKRHRLHNLGICFIARFKYLGELSDLEDAISCFQAAIELTPHCHPDKPRHLNFLGSSLITRFDLLRELSDLDDALSAYSHAASSLFGSISDRFWASRNWISCARLLHHCSLLHAYSVSVHLLPQLAWIGLSLSERYSQLERAADVVREAAAAALESGFPETAVVWLEQGRSIVWGELFELRSSFDELLAAHPDFAHNLQELSAALDHASVARERSLSTFTDETWSATHRAPESLQQEVDRQRGLAIGRDKLLQQIRKLPGFEQFLHQKQFSQLRASARSGPVVILNAAESRCDALVVLANVEHVIHVPLPKFNFKRSSGLQNMLEKLLGHSRDVCLDERVGTSATLGAVSWESLLTTLWKDIVKPILDALAFSSPGDLSRIFWCPTGPFAFLPLHAAGLYGIQQSVPGHKVFDFVISSYIPNLSILAPSPNPTILPGDNFSLLAVRQPPTDGLSRLPGVVTELELIRATVRESLTRTTLVESSAGTVEEVTNLMKEADWVHFACHGIQDGVNSGLCLADERRLRVRDIMGLSRRRHGGLAFLSACQTAMGEEGLADEALHVAAGMLFAGFGGVIGTMWSISDKLAPRVARDVYEQLFRNGTRPDHQDAARALHEAIRHLRESGKASFVTWLPFIHVGL